MPSVTSYAQAVGSSRGRGALADRLGAVTTIGASSLGVKTTDMVPMQLVSRRPHIFPSTEQKGRKVAQGDDDADLPDVDSSASSDEDVRSHGDSDFEYFPDDGYDYRQHLARSTNLLEQATTFFVIPANDLETKRQDPVWRGELEKPLDGMNAEERALVEMLQQDEDEAGSTDSETGGDCLVDEWIRAARPDEKSALMNDLLWKGMPDPEGEKARHELLGFLSGTESGLIDLKKQLAALRRQEGQTLKNSDSDSVSSFDTKEDSDAEIGDAELAAAVAELEDEGGSQSDLESVIEALQSEESNSSDFEESHLLELRQKTEQIQRLNALMAELPEECSPGIDLMDQDLKARIHALMRRQEEQASDADDASPSAAKRTDSKQFHGRQRLYSDDGSDFADGAEETEDLAWSDGPSEVEEEETSQTGWVTLVPPVARAKVKPAFDVTALLYKH